jgi:D-alanyl-lipoteichoic acid acyltransferase DltB (MBOAT superfamily)
MTFNSYLFLFAFLPIVIGGYYLLTRITAKQQPALIWLIAASLFFYAVQGPGYLAVLVGSVLGNFALLWWMLRQDSQSLARKLILALGIVANLVLLGTYKYTGFLAENINALLGTQMKALSLVYPIGLSFYTFIQIGYLIDAHAGLAKRPTFLKYVLYGTFFPYVTAGPLVRPSEVVDAMETPARQRTGGHQLAVGATMFAMGLFKKAVLADSVAPYAGQLFNFASAHENIGTGNAWIGMLAYTLQLYFDFSGYTDMALGIGYMLGFTLPVNFNTPLRATSIIDFWRRWHITMTRWFTDYVYTPLAANLMRRSVRRSYSTAIRVLAVLCLPAIVTFLLVGLWHGSGWGFVIWGGIQGAAMAANLIWREAKLRMPGVLGWLLMMVTFVVSLTFFRAPKVDTALIVLRSMFGLGPAGSPPSQFFGTAKLFGAVTITPSLWWVAGLLLIAVFFRNTQQMLGNGFGGISESPASWQPSLRWAVSTALVAATALVFAGGASPFLYYRF